MWCPGSSPSRLPTAPSRMRRRRPRSARAASRQRSAAMDALQLLCGSCEKLSVGPQATEALRSIASSATAMPTKASALARCARACARACGNCLLLERAHRVAACNMRPETDGMWRTTRNMQDATSILRPFRLWQMTRDLCRAASCSATGAAQLNCAVMQHALGIPPDIQTEKKLNNAAVIAAHRLKSDLNGKGPTNASIRRVLGPISTYRGASTGTIVHTDRHARRGDAPRPSPNAAARPATPNLTVG
jgi:hypothetical protein